MGQGLRQMDVAGQLGVSKDSVHLWETNRTSPKLPYLPKIMEFLGYSPEMANQTPGQRLRTYRRAKALSQKAFARMLGVDPSTLGKWEREERKAPQGIWDQIERISS